MKKKFLIGAAAFAAGIFCSGAAFSLADFSGYAAENGETNVAEWFSIENGASVKVDSETRGMRFATYVSKEKFDELQGKNPVFGTLFMPESDLAGEDLTLETENAANVTAEKWVNNRVAPDENGNYMYMSALINLPEEYYSSNVCARSYVTIDGETSYYTETVSRSYSGVALAAYADTSANFGAEMKNTLYNSYLNGKKFAGLDANSISYDAKKTSLTVSDGGKINVSEKGEDRAWNNVFFKYDQKFEKGKTYYFSFELKNVVADNCDLYLGVRGTEDGRKLTINGFTPDTYKKVSEGGAITFTYTAEDNFDYMRFFLFSNFDTAGAYSYSYSVDNFAVECTDTEADFVPNKAYSVKLANAKGENSVSDWTIFSRETSVLTENAVGTVTAAKIKGWQGVYLDFGTLKAGNYKLQLKVHNLSGEAVNLYTRQFKDDVQYGLIDFNSVNDSTTQTLSQDLTFDKDTSYKVRIFSANNGDKANVKFEIGGLVLERTSIDNPGTLGGMFSTPVAYGAKFKGSVSNPEIFENNYVGTAYLESGAGKCGMYFQVKNANNAPGTYRFTFTVNNISDTDITIYAEYWFLIASETYHGVKDWYGAGVVKAGEKKQFIYEFTFDGSENDKGLQLAVFTQNVEGSIIEIGDVSVDFTAAEA